MDAYDPLIGPDPGEWLALDEAERIDLVEDYHRRARVPLPRRRRRAHAAFHVGVENQLAEGVEPVRHTLERMLREGLDRHDAVHALASVLAEHVFQLSKGTRSPSDGNEAYYRDLERLTVDSWRTG